MSNIRYQGSNPEDSKGSLQKKAEKGSGVMVSDDFLM